MALSRRIKEGRKKLSLTQEQLSEKINVSVKTISNWENDKKPASIKNYIKLSQVLKISLDDLMKDEIETELESDRQIYTVLGHQLSRIANFTTADNFWMRYAICEKETTLLLPVVPTTKFIEELKKSVFKFNGKNINDYQGVNITSQKFLFNWHKFNRGNLLLSQSTKIELLVSLEKIFTTYSNNNLVEDMLFPQQPILLLRNLLFKSIKYSDHEIQSSKLQWDEVTKNKIEYGEHLLIADPDDSFKIKTKYK